MNVSALLSETPSGDLRRRQQDYQNQQRNQSNPPRPPQPPPPPQQQQHEYQHRSRDHSREDLRHPPFSMGKPTHKLQEYSEKRRHDIDNIHCNFIDCFPGMPRFCPTRRRRLTDTRARSRGLCLRRLTIPTSRRRNRAWCRCLCTPLSSAHGLARATAIHPGPRDLPRARQATRRYRPCTIITTCRPPNQAPRPTPDRAPTLSPIRPRIVRLLLWVVSTISTARLPNPVTQLLLTRPPLHRLRELRIR